ncbi:MAG TPA: GNAT family N-acetyltransferase [Cellvibrio sp.]|nr:GNAT family N-acetyltransferase [Cellvibrio sp.]
MSINTYIQLIKKEDLNTDVCVSMMISMYFGIEMQSALQWSNEHRYTELIKAQVMIDQGKSEMLLAKLYSGTAIGMIIYTEADDRPVRRIDALIVGRRFRGNGIGRMLLRAAKGDRDLHTFAPSMAVDWYLKNGFRELDRQENGTIQMTTATEDLDLNLNYPLPVFDQVDLQILRNFKQMQ